MCCNLFAACLPLPQPFRKTSYCRVLLDVLMSKPVADMTDAEKNDAITYLRDH